MYQNGEIVRLQKAITVDFTDADSFKKLYLNNIKCLELDLRTEGLTWGHEDMMKGYFITGIQLKPCNESSDLIPNIDEGPYSVEMEWNAQPAKPHDLIAVFYAIFEPHEVQFFMNGEVHNTFNH